LAEQGLPGLRLRGDVTGTASALAAFCARGRCRLREVRARPAMREAYRARLARDGVELSWPPAVRRSDA
jgi:hypothetical protein